jgi:hypothetical protein
MSLERTPPAAEHLSLMRRPQSSPPNQPSRVGIMDRRGRRLARPTASLVPSASSVGDMSGSDARVSGESLPWRIHKTQPAAQLLHRGRPRGPWQKSEAFVVATIPRRTFGSGKTRRSEGTPLVPQARSAGKDGSPETPCHPLVPYAAASVVTAHRGRGGGRDKGGCRVGELTAPEKVRQLHIPLDRKAQASPGYRFWSLSGEVQRADVRGEAWRRVKANGGAAGVDGVTLEELAGDAQLEAAWLSAPREELHRKTDRPAPVRRGYIPKASGGVPASGHPDGERPGPPALPPPLSPPPPRWCKWRCIWC